MEERQGTACVPRAADSSSWRNRLSEVRDMRRRAPWIPLPPMNWLNIPIASLRKPEFTGSDMAEVGVWLRLTCYCCAQENGGRIRDSRRWTERQWLIACGVGLDDVNRKSSLWAWSSTCLTVALYPTAKEREIVAKRAACKVTNERRKRGIPHSRNGIHPLPDPRSA